MRALKILFLELARGGREAALRAGGGVGLYEAALLGLVDRLLGGRHELPSLRGCAESEDGSNTTAARYIETLPDGSQHVMFKLTPAEPLDNMAEVTVPPGHLFVMGDNRDNSADSRVPLRDGGVGMLPVNDLVGRVDAVVGSWDLGMKHQPIWTWPSGLRLARFFTAVH